MIEELILGKDFNKHTNELSVKLTNLTGIHNGYKFHSGLNIDKKFNKMSNTLNCKYGFYFCYFSEFPEWITYKPYDIMKNLWYIDFPDDARIYIKRSVDGKVHTMRCDKFILRDRIDIWSDEHLLSYALNSFGYLLRYIDNPTQSQCLTAVKNHGMSIKYIHRSMQSHHLCIEAVTNDGYALEHCYFTNDKIFMTAIMSKPFVINVINKPSIELKMAAVTKNGMALSCINKQTSAMCIAAVKQNGFALKHVKIQTNQICLAAVKQNGLALCHVIPIFKNMDICMNAVNNNPFSITECPMKTCYLWELALQRDGGVFRYFDQAQLVINSKTKTKNQLKTKLRNTVKKLEKLAIKMSPMNIRFVERPDFLTAVKAVKKNTDAWDLINDKILKSMLVFYKKTPKR